ncbi:helix-turn-helix domain-containing protein [Caulobacter sp. BK020]|uniref:helix-turn-helix domain-containing protein n=1 Tax=Caulobacter sp. BK020 TaxID=2512117 RepID=UPI00104E853B|nr:helix-turn-helix domain-containing protein [Caulobacter sp. BK020]TCS12327.1 putative transcriptional regulator [Caulobacter sp. BK020]
MANKNFERIMEGLGEALEVAEGRAKPDSFRVHVPAEVDVRAVRKQLGLSQSQFAARFGFSTSAVADWEQGRRRPEAAARTLLMVIAREPEAVERALSAA